MKYAGQAEKSGKVEAAWKPQGSRATGPGSADLAPVVVK